MGYQIIFKYYPKKDKGFDNEATKEFTRHVGKEDEDTPIEQVATVIRAEYARRDILVYDADLYEYTKKKIKLKEIRGGLFIKDKKIMFDELPDKSTSTEKVNTPQTENSTGSVSILENISVPQINNQKAIRYEYYYPHYSLVGTPLLPPDMTPGKRYAIFEEMIKGKEGGVDIKFYRVHNDKGKNISLKEDFFSESQDKEYFSRPNIVAAAGDSSSVNIPQVSSDLHLRNRR